MPTMYVGTICAYYDFCVTVQGGLVLQSGGLGHFQVLASDAAVRGGLYMFQVWRHSWRV